METLKEQREIKGRKNYVCGFCGENILKGSKHLVSTHVADGEIYDFRVHLWCGIIAKKLDMYNRIRKHGHEGLSDADFNEFIDDDYITIITEKHSLPLEIVGQLKHVSLRQKMWYIIKEKKMKYEAT